MQNKWTICLSIAIVTGLVSPAMLFSMKRTRPGAFAEESPNIAQHKDIQSVISQKFQQFPMIENAIKFLAWEPIVLHNKARIFSVATDGDVVVTGLADGTANIWDAITGKQFIPYASHPGKVDLVAISGDIITSVNSHNSIKQGNRIIYMSTVKIWKTNGELLHALEYKNYPITMLAMNNKVLALGTNDLKKANAVSIVNIHTGKPIKTLQANTYITSLAIADNKIVTGLTDGTTQAWDIDTGKLLHTLADTVIDTVTSVGDKVITLSNNTAKIWDINTEKVLHTLIWPSYLLNSVKTVDDKVVIGSYDGTVGIWDINTGQLLRDFKIGASAVKIATTTNKIITTVSGDYVANIWTIDPYKGTPDTNPLVWIINNATVPQLDLIKRAYEATIAEDQEFIIAFPSEDAKVFLSFPMPVKQYLLRRLNIRR